MVLSDPDRTETNRDALEVLVGRTRKEPGPLIFLGGVFLPAIALVTELATRLCAGSLFDPLPSLLHTALVALVPAVNLWLVLALRGDGPRRLPLLARLNGATIGVSAFYSLIFLPMMPVGAVAILLFGIGLLLLAPAIALTACIGMRRRLAAGFPGRLPGPWSGLACALGLLVVLELHSTLTRVGMDMAASEAADSRAKGIRLLRLAGNREAMLRQCYALPNRATDLTGTLLSLGKAVPLETARNIYFQASGEPFDARPAPKPVSRGFLDLDDQAFPGRDFGQGGEGVNGRVEALSLAASRIDASIDAQAALAYQEWTLEFENRDRFQAEARALIELPPDGVVSRLTLWVDGEEREAAFASRSATRGAYQRVVQARRDPVLVTTKGKDRVLMQCFPVPPSGGRMKVRLGITSPLAFSSGGEARFHPPRFSERNFGVTEPGWMAGKGQSWKGDPAGLHSLWIDATGTISAGAGAPETGVEGGATAEEGEDGCRPLPAPALTVPAMAAISEAGGHSWRRLCTDAWLSSGKGLLIGGGGGNHAAFTEAAPLRDGELVRQWQAAEKVLPLDPVVLVVDGSAGMRPYLEDVAAAIRRMDRPVRLLLAAVEEIREYQGPAQRAGDWLERQPCVGGQDNLPALERAALLSPAGKDAVLLWIHAAQPRMPTPATGFRQAMERIQGGPRLLSVQVDNGPVRLLEELEDSPRATPLRLSGSLREELSALLSPQAGSRAVLRRARTRTGSRAGNEAAGKRTSGHLARLAAHEEILGLLASGDADSRQAAVAMASAFRLVTPVSGAVVLENAGQYREAGLPEPGSATVPGVPEPEMVALMAAAGLALLACLAHGALSRRRRRAA